MLTVGIEPTTLRLLVWCSTNWAKRALVINLPYPSPLYYVQYVRPVRLYNIANEQLREKSVHENENLCSLQFAINRIDKGISSRKLQSNHAGVCFTFDHLVHSMRLSRNVGSKISLTRWASDVSCLLHNLVWCLSGSSFCTTSNAKWEITFQFTTFLSIINFNLLTLEINFVILLNRFKSSDYSLKYVLNSPFRSVVEYSTSSHFSFSIQHRWEACAPSQHSWRNHLSSSSCC